MAAKYQILSESNKNDRLDYCQLYKDETYDKVVFSDESMFYLSGIEAKMWFKDGEKAYLEGEFLKKHK